MGGLLFNVVVVGVVSVFVLLVLFRAFFKFYLKLEIYHRTVDDYDPVIAIKGLDEPVDDLDETYATRHDLVGDPDGDVFVPYDEVENSDSPPEIVVDLAEQEKRCYGENKAMKFLRLWGYSSAAILIATAILMVYLALVQQLDVELTLPGVEWVVGVVVILSLLHFVIRLASFLPLGMPDDETGRSRLREDLHNFMFSFVMSVAVLATISVFVHLVTGGTFDGTLPYDINGTLIIASVIVVPGVLSAVSEGVLHVIPVPDHLKSDKVRHKEPIRDE